MAYTNSPLVDYTRISPNRTPNRTHAIDTITIHCVVGQCSVETLGAIFAPPLGRHLPTTALVMMAASECMSRKKTEAGAPLLLLMTIVRLPLRSRPIPTTLMR